MCVVNYPYRKANLLFYCSSHHFSMWTDKPIGFPRVMHEVRTIVSAPRVTISAALQTAFFPGQPPHETTPITSISPSTPSNAHFYRAQKTNRFLNRRSN